MSYQIFSLRDINFVYPGGNEVLKGVNFDLHSGEKVALTGHNGSGKTTMLHIIMGLLKPTSGQVLFKDREMKSEKNFRELRKGVGLLFQQADDQLFCPTVIEDVAFGPLNLGKSPDEAREIAKYVLCLLGLSGYEERVAYRLSGGEKKLVSLATVLAMQPEALVLDEPTNDLDPSMRDRLADILCSLDVAMLVVSHDLNFLKKVTSLEYSCHDGAVLKEASVFSKDKSYMKCKV
ncbi:energy-coupling factor ABC transporter ATP-binding protein [Maridesulfovibrio ferrireducens]|uniref:energy-coupling factor ABC transporter ATP-binding protein n=1 Tax=Maridesulfovibrio ferrireducens TaxID=246191 RepID=UPI001A1B8315|nr:ABC transporter ATP-binding protein [Maridesulfovibrio ferrireducens]MBI9110752.1 ABC transporter ATP-binding protein [Maridesulfovibrio ferrireducens]